MVTERLPPHDLAAEEAVLGSVLIDPEALTTVTTILEPRDFFRESHGWIYETCLTLSDRNEAINLVTIAHELQRQERLEAAGGFAYLSELAAATPTSVHAEYYAQLVQRTSLMRRLIQTAGQIAALAYEGGPDPDAVLSQAEEMLYRLRQGQSVRDFVHIREVLDKYFEENGFGGPGQGETLPAIPSGFIDLDNLLGGLQRSDLIILAARPSMGKTSFALNIAHNAAVQSAARVAVFSVEMSKEQLVQRLLSSESGVDSRRLQFGHHTEAEERRIMEATGRLAEAAIFIDDSPLLRVAEMRSKARRLHSERGVDLIIVDYLQLVAGSNSRGDNRVQEIGEISRSMKALARELNVPVVALSQLSRAVESRTPHVPMLSDLRESGSIEQDADIVMFIYRDDVYYTEEEWEKKNPNKPYPKGIADIIIAKHRNGPTGQVSLLFFEKQTKFTNLELRRGGV